MSIQLFIGFALVIVAQLAGVLLIADDAWTRGREAGHEDMKRDEP